MPELGRCGYSGRSWRILLVRLSRRAPSHCHSCSSQPCSAHVPAFDYSGRMACSIRTSHCSSTRTRCSSNPNVEPHTNAALALSLTRSSSITARRTPTGQTPRGGPPRWRPLQFRGQVVVQSMFTDLVEKHCRMVKVPIECPARLLRLHRACRRGCLPSAFGHSGTTWSGRGKRDLLLFGAARPAHGGDGPPGLRAPDDRRRLCQRRRYWRA